MPKDSIIVSTNEILYRIQKALNLSIENIIEIYKLASYEMSETHLDALLKRRLD